MDSLDDKSAPDLRRRQLLRAAAAAPLLVVPGLSRAAAAATRSLSFVHAHTGESLRVDYFAEGAYLLDAMDEINRFMRDFRTEEVTAISPQLLDFVHTVRSIAGGDSSFTVFSAYRSPATNAMLRQSSTGVAKKSHHMKGEALDIRLDGVPSDRVRDIAVSLRSGGVGLYRDSDYVHIDVGPVRQW